jgi:hypothetical protein
LWDEWYKDLYATQQKDEDERRALQVQNAALQARVSELQKSMEQKNQAELCSICNRASNSHVAACGHPFCGSCISKWVTKKANCPTCGKATTKRGITRVYGVILADADVY